MQVVSGDLLHLQLISKWSWSVPLKKMAALEHGLYDFIPYWGPSPPQIPHLLKLCTQNLQEFPNPALPTLPKDLLKHIIAVQKKHFFFSQKYVYYTLVNCSLKLEMIRTHFAIIYLTERIKMLLGSSSWNIEIEYFQNDRKSLCTHIVLDTSNFRKPGVQTFCFVTSKLRNPSIPKND